MPKKKIKTKFIGIKLSQEQEGLLTKIQNVLQLKTKTDTILQGLELLSNRFLRSYPVESSSKLYLIDNRSSPNNLVEILEVELNRFLTSIKKIKGKTDEVLEQMLMELNKVDQIIDKYGAEKQALIQILLDIQSENRWLSKAALRWISKRLDIPLNQIYHITTFYKAFSLIPRGRHSISVCLGTACHVRGAPRLLDKITKLIGIGPGHTTPDQKFNLNTVNCLGCCALGPVLVIDSEYYSNPSLEKLEQLIAALE